MRSRHRGHDLRSRTPRRVLAAIGRLGYTRTAAAKNLRTRPAAVFCFSDELAMGARQVARRRGLRIRTSSRWSVSMTFVSRAPWIRR
jgi:DNA-binding LacI/PurR family transcriptional regulator